MKNQLPGKGRQKAKHRCSVVEDPYEHWSIKPWEMAEFAKGLHEWQKTRRTVRKG